MTALRLCFVFVLLAVPAFAQTAATRATLYTEIDTLFADTGSDPITPAQLRQSLKNITASSYNGLTDGVVSSTYLPLTGGTLTGELMINPSGSASLNAYDKLRVHQAYTTLPNNSTEGNFVVFLTTGAGASGGTTAFRSFLNYVTVNGAYSAAEATGSFDNVINSITDGTKTLALLKGHDVAVRSSSAGLTTDAIGYNAMAYVTGAGSWTNYFAYRAGSPSLTSTGTIGTAYGLYLYKQKMTGVTTGYGVYQADAADINYFAGAVTLGSTVNKLTLTAPATGSTLTIADGKTLTASNTVTLTATDGSTLAIGGGGTLGTAAYTAATAYAASAQGTKADNVGAVNGIVKSNGSASFSAASAGTDYVVPAGNVATATALATPRTIGNVSFDGTANIVPETSAVIDSTDASSYPLMADSATGSLQPKTDAGLTYNATTGVLTATGFAGPLTGNVTGNVSGSAGSATGNAATATALATPRAIYGNNFNGSAALTQVIASTYGGTGNGFAKFSGPTTSEKTFTLPNSSATLLYSGGDAGTPSALVGTNISGTAAGLTAGAATVLANTRTIGNVSFNGSANIVPETITVVDSTDATSFPLMVDSATGGLQPKTDAGLSYDASTGTLTATLLATGAIGIGTTPAVANPINIAANTSSTTPTGVWVQQAIQSSATGYYYGFISYPSVVNAAFTLPSLVHFSASPSSFGAGATVSVQTGFEATSSLVGGVLNYGFRGRIDDQSGAYNLYMDGTAKNYLAGVLQLNSTIELGHATDTTIARVSAGLISVEGVNVATETYAQTAAKATKLGSHASPDTTGGSITWAASAVYEVWTNTTTTYALPAASGYDGKAVIFYVTGTNAITIDPNSSEVIVRDGTAQTGGVTLTLTGAAGNYVCLVCDGTRWVTLGYKGTLAAGS